MMMMIRLARQRVVVPGACLLQHHNHYSSRLRLRLLPQPFLRPFSSYSINRQEEEESEERFDEQQPHHQHQQDPYYGDYHSTTLKLKRFRGNGPLTRFGFGTLATLTESSVVGACGSTVVLTTVAAAAEAGSSASASGAVAPLLLTVDYRERHHGVGSIPSSSNLRRDNSYSPTVEEVLASRVIDRALRPLLLNDNTPPFHIKNSNRRKSNGTTEMLARQQRVHVTASVQACDLWEEEHHHASSSSKDNNHKLSSSSSGHPVALALNAACAAMLEFLVEPVAAVHLTLLDDGTLVPDHHYHSASSSSSSSYSTNNSTTTNNSTNNNNDSPKQPPEPIGQLLYAGTRDSVVAMEWTTLPSPSSLSLSSLSTTSSLNPNNNNKSLSSSSLSLSSSSSSYSMGLPERVWQDLLPIAHACIQPVLDRMDDFRLLKQQQNKQIMQNGVGEGNIGNDNDDNEEENHIRKSLGLPPITVDSDEDNESSFEIFENSDPDVAPSAVAFGESSVTITVSTTRDDDAAREEKEEEQEDLFFDRALQYCQERLGDAALRLFGCTSEDSSSISISSDIIDGACASGSLFRHDGSLLELEDSSPSCTVHHGPPLLSKQLRGRREQILSREIAKLVQEFVVLSQQQQLQQKNEKNPSFFSSDKDLEAFSERVSRSLMQRALTTASVRFGCRADGRSSSSSGSGYCDDGWKTIRPIQLQVPALPDSVHGSALFARGDTKVLCTVTLGAPREGLPRNNPYQPIANPKAIPEGAPDRAYETLPVGSLRFLRTQEALISDLNTKRVRAGREQTGDSGSLLEFQQAFLQYDFPAYSTGSVPTGSSAHNRRSIGHGKLAERSLLPVLPQPHEFPYAIRMTSEVTDSNGSSSMASVCGVTLALLDAGVPLKYPVAGVSVGLAKGEDDYRLLLDITGTEDHYGAMDFKIAGTRHGVTALQLDVKEPLPVSIVLEALTLAHSGRTAILQEMESLAGSLRPRHSLKASAPRVEIVRFDPQRKRDLVGPGGVVLRQLEDHYGVSLDLTQEGQCLIFGANQDTVAKAKRTVMELVADVVPGQSYTGTIVEIKDFGAIVELLRNKEGLLHVHEMPPLEDGSGPNNHRDGVSGFVRGSVRVGQEVEVLCIGVDPVQGSIKLSSKALLKQLKK